MRSILIMVVALVVATTNLNAQKSLVDGLLPPLGQMPTNDEKMYEYHGIVETEGTGSGDIEKRIRAWFKSSEFADAKMSEQEVEEAEGDWMKMKVTAPLVESHFSVQRKHSNRSVSYMVKFRFDRKEFEYWINEIQYKAKEEYPKGVMDFDVALEEFKGATAISVRQEIDAYFRDLIESAEMAANTELAEMVSPEDEPEVKSEPNNETEEVEATDNTDSEIEVEEAEGETQANDQPEMEEVTPGAEDAVPALEESPAVEEEESNSPE